MGTNGSVTGIRTPGPTLVVSNFFPLAGFSFVPMVNRYMTSQGTQVSMQDTQSKMSAMSPQSIASICKSTFVFVF